MAGFPCVNVSQLTTTPGSVLDPSCQSGLGFQSVGNYAKRHKPAMILLENVASLFHKRAVDGGSISGWLSQQKPNHLSLFQGFFNNDILCLGIVCIPDKNTFLF